jgi:probable rRNA maturation factor
MIEILNQQNKHRVRIQTFRDLLRILVSHYKLKDPEITLVFVDDQAIKKLNKEYLKKNAATDVLSFPINEKAVDDKFYLGDIIVSVPFARKQSLAKKHSLERELKILTVHGFLHLLGFEHFEGMEEEEEKIHKKILSDKNGN